MKRTRVSIRLLGFCIACIAAAPSVSKAQEFALTLGAAEAGVGEEVGVPLSLSTTEMIQGVQAVFEWSAEHGTGVGLTIDPAIETDADFVRFHVEANWITLGIITISAPLTGSDVPVATAVIECGPTPSGGPSTVAFADGVHRVAETSPILFNTLTLDRASIRTENGLELIDGSFTCLLPPPCPVENLACTSAGGVIGLSWTFGQDPGCVTSAVEVRDPTGAVIVTLPGDATTAEVPCAELETSGILCVVSIGVDGAELQACCEYTCAVPFIRGDGNDDGLLDISDAVTVLSCLFQGLLCPDCLDAADCNDDGSIDTSDAVCALGCVFGSGACPPAPFPGCTFDETPDPMECTTPATFCQ